MDEPTWTRFGEPSLLGGRYVRTGTWTARNPVGRGARLETANMAGGYQVRLAEAAIGANHMLVLPPPLDAFPIILRVVSEYVHRGTGAIIWVSPTRDMAKYRHDMIRYHFETDVVLLTGRRSPAYREKRWYSTVVCCTPEVLRNDLVAGTADPAKMALVIFEDARLAVGNHAYVHVAGAILGGGARVVGITAGLPDDPSKSDGVLSELGITKVAWRGEYDPDVLPHLRQAPTIWTGCGLPSGMIPIQEEARLALSRICGEIRGHGYDDIPDDPPLAFLLGRRGKVTGRYGRAARQLDAAIIARRALDTLGVHGAGPFLWLCKTAITGSRRGVADLLRGNVHLARARCLAEISGVEHHPKMAKLAEQVRLAGDKPRRVLVFAGHRHPAGMIRDYLVGAGMSAAVLPAAGDAGMAGPERMGRGEALEGFRDGSLDILVATRLDRQDCPEVDGAGQVVFWYNEPAAIRQVQRRRARATKTRLVTVLVARGTADETGGMVSGEEGQTGEGEARDLMEGRWGC